MSAVQTTPENANATYLVARIRDLTHRTLTRQPIPYLGGLLPREDDRYYAAAMGMLEVLAAAAADEVERLLREQEASA